MVSSTSAGKRLAARLTAAGGEVELPSGIRLHVQLVDFTDPWREPPVVLMLHGTVETGAAFRQWIPWLARHFRLVIPDLRGMGGSTPLRPDEPLEARDLIGDLRALMQLLEVPRYLVIGEKVGALLGLTLAGTHPSEVAGLAVSAGMVAPRKVLGPWIPEWIALIRRGGPRAWVDATQAGRMGDELSPAGLEWWSAMMAGAMTSESLIGFLQFLGRLEVDEPTLRAIECPTLFLVPAAAEPGDGRYDQRRPRAETDAWRNLVRGYRVAEIDSRSYHIAATRPDDCAIAVRDFFRSVLEAPQAPCTMPAQNR